MKSQITLAGFVVALLTATSVGAITVGEFQSQLASIEQNFASQGPSLDILSQYDNLLRQPNDGMGDIERALLLSKVYYKKAIIELSLGRDPQSLDDFQKSLELNPSNEGVKKNLLELIVRYGQRERLDLVRKVIQNDNDDELRKTLDQLKVIDELSATGSLESLAEAIKIAPYDALLREKRIKITEISIKSAKDLDEQQALFTGLVDDMNTMIKANPAKNSENWNRLSEVYLYGLSEFNNALSANKKCLHYDMDYEPCKKNSKFLHKYSALLSQLSSHNRFFSYAQGDDKDNDDRIQLEEMDFKDVAASLTKQEKFLKIRRENEKYSTNLSFILAKASEFNTNFGLKLNSLENTIYETLGMDAILRHDSTSFKKYSQHLTTSSLSKRLEIIDRAIQKKDFRKAHQELQSSPVNMRETTFMQNRAEKIQSHNAQQQQQQRRSHHQQHQQQFRQQPKTPKNDYYKILGVSRDADDRTIKRAYRDMTKQFHPDKYKGDMSPEEVEHKMTQINHAYEVLSDEQTRKDYDAGHDPNDPESQGGSGGGGNPFSGGGGGPQFRQGNPFGGFGGQFSFNFGGGGGGGPQFGGMKNGGARAKKGTKRS